jgi:phospholipid transport system transporter-binding protein
MEGSVTFANAASVLESGKQQFGKNDLTVDLKSLKELDSSVLAVIFEWVRYAKEQHVKIKFINIPANLKSLATLYGVVELIPA